MSIPIRKTLSIVCEGEVTEPNYFFVLAKKINTTLGYKRIKVTPKPPLLTEEEQEEIKAEERLREENGTARSGRKKLKIRNVQKEPETISIPDDYAAQPLRYVWLAQQELKIHEEAWAVYDLDQHTHHQQAFELANINGQKVHIAFSSISFETWVLMHFECCNLAFNKSQCRTGKELHLCGQGKHQNDCNGEDCTTGYLKINGYIPTTDDVKKTSYDSIAGHTEMALTNSLLLRQTYGNPIDCHNYNPITTVDRLVFKLCNISDDYKWISASDFPQKGLSYKVIDENKWEFNYTNNSGNTFILQPTYFQLCNVQNIKHPIFTRKVIEPGENHSVLIDLKNHEDFQPKYLIIDNRDSTSNIIELQALN